MSDNIIQILDSDVIDQVAAGEVIERPASVVKELLENSLDAGARNLTVRLLEGGLQRIAVEDDGSGMSSVDAKRCVERHATSKLRCVEDLFNIATWGFRGEALSSIAAVSRLSITTRRLDDTVGTQICVTAGRVERTCEIGCPTGTFVEVDDLFFNIPARRKFLRAPATEQAHVAEAIIRVMLGARRAGIVVYSGDRRLLDITETMSIEQRAEMALGVRFTKAQYFEHSERIRVSGLIGQTLGEERSVTLFVNGRFVRDRTLQRAVADCFMAVQRAPAIVLYVDVSPDSIDVNVHPQKTEVRFGDGRIVFREVTEALTTALVAKNFSGYKSKSVTTYRVGEAFAATSRFYSASPNNIYEKMPAPVRLFGRYVLQQHGDEWVWVDSWQAAQRAAETKLISQWQQGRIEAQDLLLPAVLTLSAEKQDCIARLRLFGFDIELLGSDRFVVRAVPKVLAKCDIVQLVEAILSIENAEELLKRCAQFVTIGDDIPLADIAHEAIRRFELKDLERLFLLPRNAG